MRTVCLYCMRTKGRRVTCYSYFILATLLSPTRPAPRVVLPPGTFGSDKQWPYNVDGAASHTQLGLALAKIKKRTYLQRLGASCVSFSTRSRQAKESRRRLGLCVSSDQCLLAKAACGRNFQARYPVPAVHEMQ